MEVTYGSEGGLGQITVPDYPIFFLYEKVVFKSTSAEPLPRRAIGTGQLSRLRFRAGHIARRGGGGIMPFSIFVVSARTCGL